MTRDNWSEGQRLAAFFQRVLSSDPREWFDEVIAMKRSGRFDNLSESILEDTRDYYIASDFFKALKFTKNLFSLVEVSNTLAISNHPDVLPSLEELSEFAQKIRAAELESETER